MPFPKVLSWGFVGAGRWRTSKPDLPLTPLPFPLTTSSQQRVLLRQVSVHVQDRVRRLWQPAPAGGLPLCLPAVPQPGPQAVCAQPLDPLLHAGRKRGVSWSPGHDTVPTALRVQSLRVAMVPRPKNHGWPGLGSLEAASMLFCVPVIWTYLKTGGRRLS